MTTTTKKMNLTDSSLTGYFWVLIDGITRGHIVKDDVTGEWTAYLHHGEDIRSERLGSFQLKRHAVREIETYAIAPY